ncbi:MAG TPA: hypothetical protein VL651_16135 [Bacteroidia bacterium]|jgi:hypothetical protein|nr:hypothetical protein [Bacteroidia bacterium]
MKNINLNLNVTELNVVLRALSNLPYNQVNELIEKLQQQGRAQLENGNGVSGEHQHTAN